MQKILIWTAVLVLIICAGASERAEAQVNAGILFLRITPHARAAAMGGAGVAIADDPSATHYNPAGLGQYPLSPQWTEISADLPDGSEVLDAVLIRKESPQEGYKGYDILVLTTGGIVIVDPEGTKQGSAQGVSVSTHDVSSAAAAIRRYAPFMDESESEEIATAVLNVRYGIDIREFSSEIEDLRNVLPEDYKDRTIVGNAIREFVIALKDGRISQSDLMGVRELLKAIPRDGQAAPDAIDRVRFALERSLPGMLPSTVWISLNQLFPGSITSIAGDGKTAYVASENRIMKFFKQRWDLVPPPEGGSWTAENINCMTLTDEGTLWVGTDNGILSGKSGEWTRYGVNEGLPSPEVTAISLRTPRMGWVMTSGGLARFDNGTFTVNAAVVANVGDQLSAMLARFMDTKDAVVIAAAEKTVRSLNGLGDDFVPAAGAAVNVPYSVAIRGTVTAMEFDSYDRLWIGSTLGVMRLWNDRWTVFGYREMTAVEATTASAVAGEMLGQRGSPDRVANLAHMITEYNGLDSEGRIGAGRTFYVYRNPAASQVHDFLMSGDRFLIASAAGLLEVRSGDWSRYFHAALERDQVRALLTEERETWFVTDSRVVVYQHPQKAFSFTHTNWLPQFGLDLYYDWLSYVTHIEGWGTVGVGLPFFSYGEIQRTDEFGRLGESFHSFDGAFSLSYGTRIGGSLSAGLTAKVIYSRLADQGAGREYGSGNASAFALDVGALYELPWKGWTLGAAVTNIGPDISYIDAQQSDPLPRNLGVGAAYQLDLDAFNRLTFALDVNKEIVDLASKTSELKQIIYNAGFEYQYSSMVAIRFGYMHDEDGSSKLLTLGAGLKLRGLQIDLAYIPSQGDHPLSNTVRPTITGWF